MGNMGAGSGMLVVETIAKIRGRMDWPPGMQLAKRSLSLLYGDNLAMLMMLPHFPKDYLIL
jgi:hypothetical protein